MSAPSLLPINASMQELAIEGATSRASDVPALAVSSVWDASACQDALLPWLAWALGAEEWSSSWGTDAKRSIIKNSVLIKKSKGTVSSIRRILKSAGYEDVVITEGVADVRYDGKTKYNAAAKHGDVTAWALYSVTLPRPVSNEQAAQVRRLIANSQPVRCQLTALNYSRANNLYNSSAKYDGAYNHGVA